MVVNTVMAQAIVAIILALSVLLFVANGTLLHELVSTDGGRVETKEWENIINVVVGALAGYIAAKKKR